MKKIIAGILAITCCFNILTMTEIAGAESETSSTTYETENGNTLVTDGDFIYDVSTNLAIIQDFVNTDAVSVTIPAEVNGKPVYFPASTYFRDFENLEAIYVDEANERYCSVDGVLFTKNMKTLLGYPCAKEGAYTVPAEVTKVHTGAFKNCMGLTSITLHDDVVLGQSCFEECKNLETINGTVYLTGTNHFVGCEKLTSLTIGKCEIESLMLLRNFALTELTLLPNCQFSELTISGCDSLTELTIGGIVKDLGFPQSILIGECASLKKISLKMEYATSRDISVEIIGCPALEEIIDESHSQLVLENCPSLHTLKFYDGGSTYTTFEDCSALEMVYGLNEVSAPEFWKRRGCTYISLEDTLSSGDATADGEVNIADVLCVNRALICGERLSTLAKSKADFDEDGTVTFSDALNILKKAANII